MNSNPFRNKRGQLREICVRLLSYWREIYPEHALRNEFDLRALVEKEGLTPSQFYRFRQCGDARQPGKIVLFLFPAVKSATAQRAEKALAMAGDGI